MGQPRRHPAWPRKALLALAFALPCTVTLAAQTTPVATTPEARTYDHILDTVVARYHLPGIALGVIENGKVVYVATRGETVAGSGQKITPRTLFEIASNSKAMTTALLGRLVDQGKLHWDDPVTKYLPGFQMYDPWVTKNMRVADLLTHSSGLPEGGGDLMLWPEPNGYTRADIIHGLRYIKPGYSFRSKYEYDNLLYVVAGEVAAAAGGAPYETLMHREVFQPLGLSRCQVGEWNRDTVGDVAAPHAREDSRNIPRQSDNPVIPAITSAPAGGIRCDLDDMLAWARNWLVPTPAQLQWLSAEQRHVLQSPHMLIPVSQQRRDWDNSHIMAYGYGWRMTDVDGTWTVWHTGTLDGMYSELMLLPDRKDGFVFLINGEAESARTVLGEALLKHFTKPDDAHDVTWYADAQQRADEQATRRAAAPDTSKATPVAPAALAAWTGRYRDPWLGDLVLCPSGERVHFAVAKSPRLNGDVMRLGNRDLVHWSNHGMDPDAWLDFHPARDGQPATLTMAKVDALGDFSSDYEDLHFVRTGDCP
ncbi:serine hydrolase [Rhodanobacter sp. DHB23]|uniref:serine hydrolase n=1 Tax=Rhodanobacter sp. DHB23 TaxID=2775923 RepID=UPI00177DAF5B|nr:serine hydrolase [Rhodanobacter sp. DHB23]MBD8874114.1 serine hydrolase [Rhodanobacter sp. DHB23]